MTHGMYNTLTMQHALRVSLSVSHFPINNLTFFFSSCFWFFLMNQVSGAEISSIENELVDSRFTIFKSLARKVSEYGNAGLSKD